MFDSSSRRRSRDLDADTLIPLGECLNRVQRSTDMMAAEAEKCFYDCDYKQCLKILNEYLRPRLSGILNIKPSLLGYLK